MAEPTEPQTLGQYIIDQKIAQGGMAEIFLGRSMEPAGLERSVVIKRILPHIAASPEFVSMLVQEAKLAVQLSHGNIAQIFDLGKIGDDYFMVMEYVDGDSLSHIARQLRQTAQCMPIPVALYIASEVANGLDYMHNKTDAQGKPLHIVHRDISPQNIIVSKAGTIKIIDFGIAKAASQVTTTDSGVVKGKFAYMSPEHVEGEKLDGRADIFSLGVILWELLTNQRLFKGKNNKETIQRVKRCRIPSPSGYQSQIPKEVDRIVKKALSKNLKSRYQSAHDLQLDLIRTLVHHYPDFAPKDLQRFVQDLLAGEAGEEPTLIGGRPEPEAPTQIGAEPEPTAFADPRILKKRLEELEAYRVVGAETSPETAPTSSEAEGAAPVETPTKLLPLGRLVTALGRRLASLPWRRLGGLLPWFMRGLAAVLVLGAISAAGYYGYHYLISWWQGLEHPPPPMEQVSPLPETKPPPPPAVPSPPAVGRLDIQSTPAGARIFLNDQDTGRTTPALLENLGAGRQWHVGLFLHPYRYWEGDIAIRPDKTTQVSAVLEINVGSLEIDSLPSGATVWVDGKKQGQTPFSLPELQPDTVVDLRIEHPGYKSWTGSAEIFAGKTTTVRAVLERP